MNGDEESRGSLLEGRCSPQLALLSPDNLYSGTRLGSLDHEARTIYYSTSRTTSTRCTIVAIEQQRECTSQGWLSLSTGVGRGQKGRLLLSGRRVQRKGRVSNVEHTRGGHDETKRNGGSGSGVWRQH